MALVMEKVVTSRFDNPDVLEIEGYEGSGGYQAIRKLLGTVDPKDVIAVTVAQEALITADEIVELAVENSDSADVARPTES